MTVYFVGADISTKKISLAGVGLADWQTSGYEWRFAEVVLPPASVPGRGLADALLDELPAAFWDQTLCVWIEEPFGGINPRTFGALSAVKGALADAIPAHVVVDSIRPSVWRKEVGIPGNAKRAVAKAASRAWCYTNGLPDDLSEDLCDAAVIAWTCLQQSDRASEQAA